MPSGGSGTTTWPVIGSTCGLDIGRCSVRRIVDAGRQARGGNETPVLGAGGRVQGKGLDQLLEQPRQALAELELADHLFGEQLAVPCDRIDDPGTRDFV